MLPLKSLLSSVMRACALLMAISVISLVAAPQSHAFNWLGAPPPVTSAIDANGADLGSGGFVVSAAELVIGQPGAGGMTYARTFMSVGEAAGWRDNWAGTINSTSDIYTVSLGASSETFTLSSGVFTSDQGRGATLTYNSGTGIYTYTNAFGVEALFDEDLANSQISQPLTSLESRRSRRQLAR